MTRILNLLLLITICLFASVSSRAQFSITATAGTLGPTAYTSLNAAIGAVNAGTHQGNIVISVTANSTETMQSTLYSSGTGAASYTSILIKPAASVTPTIQGSLTCLLLLQGADNVTIDGSNTVGGTTRDMTLKVTSGTVLATVLFIASASAADGATNNTIKNCIIQGSAANVTACGITTGHYTAIGTGAIAGCNNNTVTNNAFSQCQNAIYLFGYSAGSFDANWVITNNSCSSHGFRGMILQNCSNFLIAGNTINGVSATTTSTPTGIMLYGSFSGGNVYNNQISSVNNGLNGCNGIWLISSSAGSNINVYNNFIRDVWCNSGTTGSTWYDNGWGIVASSFGTGGGYNVYHNTVNLTTPSTGTYSAALNIEASLPAGSVNLRDNILVNNQASGAANRLGILCSSANTVFSAIDYNDYYSAQGNHGRIGAVNRTTLAQIQTGFGTNTNSIVLSPTFMSSTDLHLQTVPANDPLDAGVSIASPSITTDIDGDSRVPPPTMGADEVYTNNIAYTTLPGTCSTGDVTLNPVTINSAVGISLSGTYIPRIYFKKGIGPWFSQAGTYVSGTGGASTWSFVIPAATMGGVAIGDVISYYVIAQTTLGVVFSTPSTGLVATDVLIVTTPPTTPDTYTINGVTMTGIATPQTVCYSAVAAQAANFAYSSTTGSPDLYTLTWSPAGPTNVSSFTALLGSPITANVPAGTAVGAYTGTLTIKSSVTTCVATYMVTINVVAPPAAITGILNICPFTTTTLSDATPGGTWSSSSSAATVGASTGIVTGVSFGTSTITYTAPSGCYATAVVTVNVVASITGITSVCVGRTTTLSDATPGGTWSVADPTKASISSTGVVTGLVAGTTTVTYTSPVGCFSARTITVNPLPAAIGGTLTVCPGTTTTATDATAGGTWSTSAGTGSVTIVSSTGVITGSAAGTATITYTLGTTGCFSTAIVTINPLPSFIIGSYNMCAGATTTFTDGTPGGTWSSSSAIVSIGSLTGIATAGATAGTATISYTLTSTGCYNTATVTVNALPAPITGSLLVCPALTTTLSDATPGGTWSINPTSVATIDAGGVVTGGPAAGTATVTYTAAGTGCERTAVVTVNTPPAAIGGTPAVCVGFTTTLTDATPGGTWSSSSTGIATVGASNGVVLGISPGTTTIRYTVTATGCFAAVVVTVNPGPGTISGTAIVCVNQTTTLTSSSPGGSWSSSDVTIATVGVSSGIVTGQSAGTAIITTSLGTGCNTTKIVTVNPLPAAISGPTEVCVGKTITMSTTSPGITWSSSDVTIATIISGTGLLTGVSVGVATITCGFISTGCYTTTSVTVNPLPAAITGTISVCSGQTSTLSNASPGGTWSTGSAIASIGSLTGIVTGGSVSVATTATVTYTLPTGCIRTATVTVNPLPTAITSSTGTMAVCVGSTIVLSGTPGGGTWTCACPTIASVGSSSGVLTGIAAGTCTVTYTITSTGCYIVTTVTVNPLPAAIAGALTVCPGTCTTLSDATSGGVWSSNNLAIATIGASSGIACGVSAGVVTMIYTLPTGCRATAVLTVNPLPAAITGTATVCEGQNTTLSDATAGGSWSTTAGSGSVNIGSSTGIVTGLTAGTATVTYTLSSTSCYITRIVTVMANPAAIGGASSVCAGSCATLTDATASGNWISGNPSVATINPTTGVFCGVSAGTAVITYILSTGCYSTTIVTVTTAPSAITGTMTVCEGATTTLTSLPAGGTWSSSDNTIAAVGASGVVTGVLGFNTATITYSLGTGCTKTATVTVNISPALITGGLGICVGTTTTLSDATPGGSWSSSATGIATVSASGVVLGIAQGTVTVSYAMPSGCARWVVVTVNSLPAAITGTMTVCQGLTTTLSSPTAGGNWNSSDATIASVNPVTGVVTGVSGPGTATITYSLGTGCITTAVVTVLPLPAAISGTLAVCSGLTTTLSDATLGGTWSSSNPAVATIGLASGIVTAISTTYATATITYTLASTGCYITAEVTVNPLPAPITGASGFCNLTTTTLSDATPGGTWSSANAAIADFPSATLGALTAVSVGTVTVTYTLPTGCITTKNETIILAPYPISGSPEVCVGSCTTLGNIISGGTWTSSDPLIASIATPAGVACGLTAGTATISYELSNGCFSTQTETVNPTPGAITGTHQVCVGQNITLSNSLPGGGWSSSDASIASVDPGGVVTGVVAGTATISYSMATGCYATIVVTVNPLPAPITGTLEVCVGLTTSLSTTSTGVGWTSTNSSIAAVSSTGIVTGITSGTADIICGFLSTGCSVSATVTVDPLPSAITGTMVVCQGNSSTLSNISAGGVWSSSDPSIASINAFGIVTGIAPGTTTIVFTQPTGCIATAEFTVNPIPSAIGGSLTVCTGFMSNLTNTIPGGIWSMSGSTMVATIHPLTGVVTGITPGTITVTYTLGTGCAASAVVTVNPLPPAITGVAAVCEASTTTLADAVAGGTWTSSDAAIATVDPALGVVSGVSAGNATITYTITTGCINIRHVTVNPLPGAISGASQVCEHFTTTLSSTPAGEAWTSSNTVIASVGLTSGMVTGLAMGTTNISYTIVATGCTRIKTMTVNPTPHPITGSSYICIGQVSSLSDTYPGGSWSSGTTIVATIGSATGVANGLSFGSSVITYMLPVTGCYVTKSVTVSPLPNVYNVTGGGHYCAGGTGVYANLSGSQIGVSYAIYNGTSATGYVAGSGIPMNLGPLTIAGIYTVLATNATSGCTRNMTGSASVVIDPLVTPTVTVVTPSGTDTVCSGGPRTFTAYTTTGGTAPSYTWKVNGLTVGSGSTYTFIPADGDSISITMNSTLACASPATVNGHRKVKVLPEATPIVSVLADPGDTICQFTLANYTASSTYGGSSPVYTWMVNGAVAGTGTTFAYEPDNGDIVTVQMTSNYVCAITTTVTSGAVAMAVDSMIVPHVTISATPGLMVNPGVPITLNTSVTHAGVNPSYQWKVNGVPVPGETNASYTSTFNHYDSVTCMVTSDGWCRDITTFDWVFITIAPLGVHQAGLGGDLMLLPNPNKGEFTIRGTLGSIADQELTAEVTNMLGQVVYRTKVMSRQGRVEERIQLDNTLANGMYILNLRSESASKVFHFVMEQ